MNTNAAIVEIVLNSAEQIRMLALEAIDRLPEVRMLDDETEIVPAVMEPFNQVVERAREAMREVSPTEYTTVVAEETQDVTVSSTTEGKKPRGRPRKTEVSTAAQEVAKQSEEMTDKIVELRKEVETIKESIVKEEDVFGQNDDEPEDTTPDFASMPIEEARKMIRAKLSERLSKIGQEAVREEIKQFSTKIRVTDFDADDCRKAYEFWEGK